MKKIILLIIFFIAAAPLVAWTASPAKTEHYLYSSSKTVIGSIMTYTVKDDESLIEIARKFKLGYNEIADANADTDPFVPGNGTLVTIPSSWILPDVKSYEGIVINLSEMRLYYFFKRGSSKLVATFPVGIGSEGNDTPTGEFKIAEKIVKPSWRVPESIRKEKPQLPEVVPSGPDNPLGSHALRLSLRSYLIHGTNRPWGVGRRASHGCIRLYPEDIPKLFKLAPKGGRVTIIKQPVKASTIGGKVFIEVHKDDYHQNEEYSKIAVKLLKRKNLLEGVNTEKLHAAIKEKKGIPVEISN
ncbi:MAG: L,D-transpeptidase family protein [Thermodesulfovibrionales bacterium]|nr:L,D-transpeptidase family protein [Thermodesulfovibrionales bacterium]